MGNKMETICSILGLYRDNGKTWKLLQYIGVIDG